MLTVARVELKCPLEISSRFFPVPLTPLDVSPLVEISADRWAGSGGQLPVQPERRHNRGIRYKDAVLVQGVLRLHLDGCGMLPEWLLLLTPTAQEYGRS